jgi:hypothetical protein
VLQAQAIAEKKARETDLDNLRKCLQMGDPDVDGRIILRGIFRKSIL